MSGKSTPALGAAAKSVPQRSAQLAANRRRPSTRARRSPRRGSVERRRRQHQLLVVSPWRRPQSSLAAIRSMSSAPQDPRPPHAGAGAPGSGARGASVPPAAPPRLRSTMGACPMSLASSRSTSSSARLFSEVVDRCVVILIFDTWTDFDAAQKRAISARRSRPFALRQALVFRRCLRRRPRSRGMREENEAQAAGNRVAVVTIGAIAAIATATAGTGETVRLVLLGTVAKRGDGVSCHGRDLRRAAKVLLEQQSAGRRPRSTITRAAVIVR